MVAISSGHEVLGMSELQVTLTCHAVGSDRTYEPRAAQLMFIRIW